VGPWAIPTRAILTGRTIGGDESGGRLESTPRTALSATPTVFHFFPRRADDLIKFPANGSTRSRSSSASPIIPTSGNARLFAASCRTGA